MCHARLKTAGLKGDAEAENLEIDISTYGKIME
jgi:hypothetical protein